MKLDQERRALLKVSGISALLLPFSLLFKTSGCATEHYDVEIGFCVSQFGTVLNATLNELSGVQYDWNKFDLNGREEKANYVYSIKNMWGDWVFEVNGNRIYANVSDFQVIAGDRIVWKGIFLR